MFFGRFLTLGDYFHLGFTCRSLRLLGLSIGRLHSRRLMMHSSRQKPFQSRVDSSSLNHGNVTASILYPSITIRLRRLPGTFWHLVRSIVRALRNFFVAAIFFSSLRKFFRLRENLGKKSLDRRDQFCPKIVEIGAILAIFEPFEV